jgi:TonB family protein
MSKALTLLAGYGAFELKRAYRKNMAIGILSASAAFLVVIGSILIITNIQSAKPEAVGTIVLKSTADLGAPPTLSTQDIPIRVATPDRAAPSVGVPTPVPDEEAPEDEQIATMDDLAAMAAPEPVMDLDDMGNKDIVIENMDDLLPTPDQFVAYEEAPEKIEEAKLDYPEMARRASIEGVVWIQALVDKEGKVRDVIVVKDSGANAGFEDAAVQQAYKTTWKPAISNGQPVAVWVTYKVVFKLKGN